MLASIGYHAFAGAILRDDDVPPLTKHTFFTQWEFAPVVTAIVAVLAALYLYGVWRVRRKHPARPWPLLRTASFMLGLGVIVIATQSSIGAYDDVLFWIHMWQHLLLIMVAPVFLLLGQPVTLLLHASRNPLHTWVKRFVRSRAVAVVTFPVVGVLLYTATVAGTHLTNFMNLTLEHPVVHDTEHGVYLLAGYLYFLPLIGKEPIRWRMSLTGQLFLLLLAMPIDTFTGVILLQAELPLFSAYAGRRTWGPSLVNDLHDGGASMWVGGDSIMLVIIIALFIAALRSRTELDAGRWLEGVRSRRFAELTAAGGPEPVTEDEQLVAYNAYLERLNHKPGQPAGGAT